MLLAALSAFVLAALAGITLLFFVLNDKERPKWLISAHGVLAAIGLLLLIIYGLHSMDPRILIACGIFIIVALVGFYMAHRDRLGHKVPKAIALMHGSIGALTFLYLLYVVVYKIGFYNASM